MKKHLEHYEASLPIDATHQAAIRARVAEALRPAPARRWWLLLPAAVGFAVLTFVLRGPTALPEARAAELLSKAADAFITVPNGEVLRISRSMTGIVEYDDGTTGYGVTGSDDIFYDGESYAWTTFAAQTQDGMQADPVASLLAVLNGNGITYTKYEWIPEGCMENDGVQTCYDEQVTSYEMADHVRHMAEISRRAGELGIEPGSPEIKRIARELSCNEELNVYAIETDPLYEILYAQSNLQQVQNYLDGGSWCPERGDCPLLGDRAEGTETLLFLAPTVVREDDVYHVTVAYNPEAVALLGGDAEYALQWEIWITEDGMPTHEILRKNGVEVQGVSYAIQYIPKDDIGHVLTFDGWREVRGIAGLPYNPSFAPWGYTEEQEEYERSLRLAACTAGETPVSRSGGTAMPTILIPSTKAPVQGAFVIP